VTVRQALRTRDRRVPEQTGPERETVDDTVSIARRLDLVAAMGQLPRAQRAAVVLRYFYDTSVADVAATLAVKTGIVKAQLHQGRHRLASLLAEEVDDVAR